MPNLSRSTAPTRYSGHRELRSIRQYPLEPTRRLPPYPPGSPVGTPQPYRPPICMAVSGVWAGLGVVLRGGTSGTSGTGSGSTAGAKSPIHSVLWGAGRPSFNFRHFRKRLSEFDWKSTDLYVDPGYKFRIGEGIQGLENSASGVASREPEAR